MSELQLSLETSMRYVPTLVNIALSKRDLSGLRYTKEDIVRLLSSVRYSTYDAGPL